MAVYTIECDECGKRLVTEIKSKYGEAEARRWAQRRGWTIVVIDYTFAPPVAYGSDLCPGCKRKYASQAPAKA